MNQRHHSLWMMYISNRSAEAQYDVPYFIEKRQKLKMPPSTQLHLFTKRTDPTASGMSEEEPVSLI